MNKNNFSQIKQFKPLITINKERLKISGYIAKSFFNEEWNNKESFALVKKARRSYLRYGNVPLFDEFDKKSLIVLIKTEYKLDADILTEWLSVRFVPADGKPDLTEDFLHCEINNSLLKNIFKKKTYFRSRGKKSFFTISRLCKISPEHKKINKGKIKSNFHAKKNNYTAYAFALANQIFIDQLGSNKKNIVITGLFREEVIKKSLTLNLKSGIFPEFIPAYKTFGFSKRAQPKIKIDKYIFKYPGYFLDIKKLTTFINKLLELKLITKKTLLHYLKIKNTNQLDIFLADEAKNFNTNRNLGNLLNAQGILKFGKINSLYLREMVKNEISVVPELKAMKAEIWECQVKKILSYIC